MRMIKFYIVKILLKRYREMKKIFSLILSLAMLLTITSGLNLTAYADSSQYGNIYYEEGKTRRSDLQKRA